MTLCLALDPPSLGVGQAWGLLFSQEHFPLWLEGLELRDSSGECRISPWPPGLPPFLRGGCGQLLLTILARQLDHELGIKIFGEDSDSQLGNSRGHTRCNVLAQNPGSHCGVKELHAQRKRPEEGLLIPVSKL